MEPPEVGHRRPLADGLLPDLRSSPCRAHPRRSLGRGPGRAGLSPRGVQILPCRRQAGVGSAVGTGAQGADHGRVRRLQRRLSALTRRRPRAPRLPALARRRPLQCALSDPGPPIRGGLRGLVRQPIDPADADLGVRHLRIQGAVRFPLFRIQGLRASAGRLPGPARPAITAVRVPELHPAADQGAVPAATPARRPLGPGLDLVRRFRGRGRWGRIHPRRLHQTAARGRRLSR